MIRYELRRGLHRRMFLVIALRRITEPPPFHALVDPGLVVARGNPGGGKVAAVIAAAGLRAVRVDRALAFHQHRAMAFFVVAQKHVFLGLSRQRGQRLFWGFGRGPRFLRVRHGRNRRSCSRRCIPRIPRPCRSHAAGRRARPGATTRNLPPASPDFQLRAFGDVRSRGAFYLPESPGETSSSFPDRLFHARTNRLLPISGAQTCFWDTS